MPAEELTISTTRDPQSGVETLKVTGPTTLATVFEFQTALRTSTGPKTIVDLSAVPYMDSAGPVAILSFRVRARERIESMPSWALRPASLP